MERRLESGSRRAGFTLMELMLVVIIIGILASMVVPSFVGRAREARVKAAKGEIAILGVALDLFELDKGRYPNSLGELLTSDRPYLKEKNVPRDPWDSEYIYRYSGGTGYELKSRGPDGVEGSPDDISSSNL